MPPHCEQMPSHQKLAQKSHRTVNEWRSFLRDACCRKCLVRRQVSKNKPIAIPKKITFSRSASIHPFEVAKYSNKTTRTPARTRMRRHEKIPEITVRPCVRGTESGSFLAERERESGQNSDLEQWPIRQNKTTGQQGVHLLHHLLHSIQPCKSQTNNSGRRQIRNENNNRFHRGVVSASSR